MKSFEKQILMLTVGGHALIHLFDGVIPPLLPILRQEFGTDYFHLGLVVTAFSYLLGFGSLPAGYLVTKLGAGKLISLYLFGAGGAFLMVAVSGVLDFAGVWIYGIIMATAGLFCSTYHPAANTLISNAISERGRAFGIHGMAGSIGAAAAPVLTAWLGLRLGWRAPHILFGAFGMMLGVYSLRVRSHCPDQVAEAPRTATVVPAGAIGTIAEGGQVVSSAARAIPDIGAERPLSYIALGAFFVSVALLGLAYRGTITFLPAYFGERIDLLRFGIKPVSVGGIFATISLLAGAVGQYIGGRAVDKYSPRRLYFFVIFISGVFMFIMTFAEGSMLVMSSMVFAFAYFASQPIQNDLLARYLPARLYGPGYGIHFFIVFGVGSFAAAPAGFIADRYGLTAVFQLMGWFLILAALVAGLFMRRRIFGSLWSKS